MYAHVPCVCVCDDAARLRQWDHSGGGFDPGEAADRGQRWGLALRGVWER